MKEKIKKIYKKILERKLVKNFLMIFTGQGISSLFGLFATIMIISAIGSEQHGVLIVIQTYSTLFLVSFLLKRFKR